MTQKQLRQEQKPAPNQKIPRQACRSCDFLDQKLSWGLSRMDLEGPFGWNLLFGQDSFWQDIFPKLKDFERRTWNEISGDRHHAISVDKLSPTAQKRLELLKLDDSADTLFSLALNGRNRIIGIRDRNVFRVLWWDPNHEVCPSQKKHT